MNKLTIRTIVLATSMAWNLGAMAETMPKADYQHSRDRLATEFHSAKEGCNSMSGNARDICIADAKGQNRVALTELEAAHKPTAKNKAEIRVARAEAEYAVAMERCDDLAGNAKDVCVKEAKSAEIGAKADLKAQKKASEAGKVADDKSAAAHDKASQKSGDARQDAAEDKRDASYEVAKEKCDAFSGNAKDLCIDKAKLNFGKS